MILSIMILSKTAVEWCGCFRLKFGKGNLPQIYNLTPNAFIPLSLAS